MKTKDRASRRRFLVNAEALALAMVLPARSAEATPTSSAEPTGYGALTEDALMTPTWLRGSGSLPVRPTPGSIQDGAGTVQQLLDFAADLPPQRAMTFLRSAFGPALPKDGTRKDRTILVDGQLALSRLLYVAKEWDRLGTTTPTEFVDALAAEVVGHPKNEAVSSIMLSLSDRAERIRQDESEEDNDDDYGRWRHGRD